jgi:hypothetical protein
VVNKVLSFYFHCATLLSLAVSSLERLIEVMYIFEGSVVLGCPIIHVL